MDKDSIIKYEGGFISRVSNAISLTNKLLKLANPELIPYRKKTKWGYCSPEKKIVIGCRYDEAEPFNSKFARVKINKIWHHIDKRGKIIIPLEEDSASEIDELSDVNEKEIYPQIIDLEDQYFLVNQNGEQLNQIPYDGIDNRGFGFSNGLIDVARDEQWGFIDKNGREIISCIYDEVYPFSDGLAGVLKDDYWGFVDVEGKEIIPLIYYQVFPFWDGLAKIETERNRKWIDGYINKDGIEYWDD